MGASAILIITFIVLVIIRANNIKFNSFTVLLCIAILGSTGNILLDWDLHEIFYVIVPIVTLALAFWIGKKFRNEKNKERVMSKQINKKEITDEELYKIVNDFKTSSIYNRFIQSQSSSNEDDIQLTHNDFAELMNFSTALEEMKKRGMIEDEIPDITLHITPTDKDDDRNEENRRRTDEELPTSSFYL